ncbi:MAG: type transport system ATP-binding protein [Solirubrobacteraceae bacterium]|jgi:ABC-type polysaccharide/polyol phosphate transport system ATPase subunit|nr:type transport system ATP-binding protein [Solirubrobacteraceae bacterium]
MADRYAGIDVDRVSKTFRVPRQHVGTLKERAMHPFRRVEIDELRALEDVSFQVLEGEFFGIVGRNGSGKSTLLKCLAGIYKADTGRILIAGRLTPFIELGVGFNMELTALDNVVINGVMMGLTPAEARARFDDVIAFAELEDFLDLKLKNYSSGMQVRLAFSLMVQSDADVLLIDEVLAVGDAAFQQKCFNEFRRLRDEGRTIVLVTHDMATIERFCHRALLLERGHLMVIGDPGEVGARYMELNFERQRGAAGQGGGRGVATVAGAWIEDAEGRAVDAAPHGEPLTVHVALDVHEAVERPEIHVQLTNDDGVRIFGTTTRGVDAAEPALEPGERVEVRVRMDNPLGVGRFYVDVGVHTEGGGMLAYEGRAREFIVHGAPENSGLVSIPHQVEVQRAGSPAAAPR